MHKSGFVSILGNPNVGKSTLMNRLVGERLSIVTSKAQTTRHRIFGIVDTPDYQIVYSDTPGILAPAYELQRTMLKAVEQTLEDSDFLLYITDVVENPGKHSEFFATIAKSPIPKLVLINKIDLTDQHKLEGLVDQWAERLPGAEILPISALHGFGVELIQPKIISLLPEGEKYFPPDTLKILLYTHQEVPYSVEISVSDYREERGIDRIEAVIYVARDSQRGILIGQGGRMLKRIGIEARKDLERFLQKHVYLGLTVQVADNWRDDPDQLKRFGYTE